VTANEHDQGFVPPSAASRAADAPEVTGILTAHLFVTHPHYSQTMRTLQVIELLIQ